MFGPFLMFDLCSCADEIYRMIYMVWFGWFGLVGGGMRPSLHKKHTNDQNFEIKNNKR